MFEKLSSLTETYQVTTPLSSDLAKVSGS